MSNVLEVLDLKKDYENFSLDSISFTLPAGFIMGLIGPNGAGKTTTIKSILNMIHRKSGLIRINGLDNIKYERKIKQDIGVVFDTHCLCQEWNIRDAEKVLSPFYQEWNHYKFNELVSKFRISKDKPIKDLSRGMQMRCMLACALSHNANLLIFDEPTSGLDPIVRNEFLQILSEYISDGTRSVLFSTHITSDLEKVADYITLIDNGTLLYSGSKDELIDDFRRIAGGRNEITDLQRNKIFGYHETSTGFEGLVKTTDLLTFKRSIMVEPTTIEQIMIAVHQGVDNE